MLPSINREKAKTAVPKVSDVLTGLLEQAMVKAAFISGYIGAMITVIKKYKEIITMVIPKKELSAPILCRAGKIRPKVIIIIPIKRLKRINVTIKGAMEKTE